MSDNTPGPLSNVITIDDDRIKNHLDRIVPGSVEETLNALLDAEADRPCNAQRYECSEARRDTRAGHYERKLQSGSRSCYNEGKRCPENAVLRLFLRKRSSSSRNCLADHGIQALFFNRYTS